MIALEGCNMTLLRAHEHNLKFFGSYDESLTLCVQLIFLPTISSHWGIFTKQLIFMSAIFRHNFSCNPWHCVCKSENNRQDRQTHTLCLFSLCVMTSKAWLTSTNHVME